MKEKNRMGLFIFWSLAALLVLLLIQQAGQISKEEELPYSKFKEYLKNEQIVEIKVSPDIIHGEYRTADNKRVNFKTVPLADPKLVEQLEEYKVSRFSGAFDKGWLMPLLVNWGPMILLILFWWWLIKGMQTGGKQVMSFGRSRAKLQSTKKSKITFADVAGVDEAKEELQEIVEFLRDTCKISETWR